MSDHYEILGVKRDATSEDIKKAYQHAARKNHSDRGGDDKIMSDVNVAYDTLSDPERRAHYDATGQSHLVDIDAKASSYMLTKAMQWIQMGCNGNMVDFVKQCLAQDKALVKTNSENSKRLMENLTKTAGKIKHKGTGRNKIKDAIMQQIAHLEGQKRNIDSEEAALDAALVMIDEYQYDQDIFAQHLNTFQIHFGNRPFMGGTGL
jgi:curved DNA-binding protein CbpA